MRRLHLGILRGASFLIGRPQRAEWLAEWRAELWYVSRSGKNATGFCLGAINDALCLKRIFPPERPSRYAARSRAMSRAAVDAGNPKCVPCVSIPGP